MPRARPTAFSGDIEENDDVGMDVIQLTAEYPIKQCFISCSDRGIGNEVRTIWWTGQFIQEVGCDGLSGNKSSVPFYGVSFRRRHNSDCFGHDVEAPLVERDRAGLREIDFSDCGTCSRGDGKKQFAPDVCNIAPGDISPMGCDEGGAIVVRRRGKGPREGFVRSILILNGYLQCIPGRERDWKITPVGLDLSGA